MHGTKSSPRNLIFTELVKNFSRGIECKNLLPCSQKSSTAPYPVPNEYSPQPNTTFLRDIL